MLNPARRASATSSLCSVGVTLSATGLLRRSFAFFGGLPILGFLVAIYISYTQKFFRCQVLS